MLTLAMGGRCFIGDEPENKDAEDTTWQTWHARKTGYDNILTSLPALLLLTHKPSTDDRRAD